MKIRYSYLAAIALAVTTLLGSCQKEEFGSLNTGEYTDTDGTLKAASAQRGFPFGIAIDYNQMVNNAAYREAVLRDASSTTFEYHMKHGALVRNDGTLDFSRADQLYNLVSPAGIEVFGHTLGWHQNQNATYLNGLTGAGGGTGTGPTNLVKNPGFEQGSGDDFTNWGKWNGAASLTAATATADRQEGQRAVKVTVAANGNPWAVQLASDLFPTQSGKSYRVTFYIRAQTAGGKMRVSTQGGTAQYSPDFNTSTDWGQFSWTFPATANETRILFDVGSTANTYFIDNVSVTDASASAPPTGAQVAARVDEALQKFITETVTHYKGKVKAWDVVNEPMADGGGALRVRSNSSVPAGSTDYFFWSDYLGRNWALKAFQYAKAADPQALLFINDYNLESNPTKLDSLIGYVNELKAKGAPIDGIGTQMHISINTSHANIRSMFKKLAATGLKVRISELDVRLNPGDLSFINADALHLGYQAAMYQFVVDSYLELVPASQRHGITVWGVSDQYSWIVQYQNKRDSPLLFNNEFQKKPAYSAVLQSLKRGI